MSHVSLSALHLLHTLEGRLTEPAFVTFLFTVTNSPTKLKEEGFVMAPSEELQPPKAGQTQWQERESAGSMASTVRKQRETDAGAQLTFSFLLSADMTRGHLLGDSGPCCADSISPHRPHSLRVLTDTLLLYGAVTFHPQETVMLGVPPKMLMCFRLCSQGSMARGELWESSWIMRSN